jgi:hypothetical protein
MSLITQPNPCGFLLALFIHVYVLYNKNKSCFTAKPTGSKCAEPWTFPKEMVKGKSCDLYKAPWPPLLRATT